MKGRKRLPEEETPNAKERKHSKLLKVEDYKEALDRIRINPITVTPKISKEMEIREVSNYVEYCIQQFFMGHYGLTPLDDVQSNINALVAGEGRIIARYSAAGLLSSDFYIIAYFSVKNKGVDYNYTTILHCNEY